MPRKVMFCYITQQQITNAMPAALLEVDEVVAIFTFLSFTKNWFKSFKEFLSSRNIVANNYIYLNDGMNPEKWSESNKGEADLDKIEDAITEKIKEYEGCEIYLNIGGGTKLLTLAMVGANKKVSSGHIEIIYLNSLSSGTSLIKLLKDGKQYLPVSELGNFELKIEEYLSLFYWSLKLEAKNVKRAVNFSILNDQQARLFIEEYRLSRQVNYLNQLKIIDDEQDLSLGDFKTGILHWLENQLGVADDKSLQRLFKSLTQIQSDQKKYGISVVPGSILSQKFPNNTRVDVNKKNYVSLVSSDNSYVHSGFIYEEFVLDGMKKLLSQSSFVADLASNITISRDNRELGEFDFMVLTKDCRLYSFDIKTKSESLEKFYSSLLKLKNLGGVYLTHYIVVPVFLDDAGLDYFERKGGPLHIIDELKRNKIPFIVYTNRNESDDATFYLVQKKGGEKWHREIHYDLNEVSYPWREEAIQCKTVTQQFKEWRILN